MKQKIALLAVVLSAAMGVPAVTVASSHSEAPPPTKRPPTVSVATHAPRVTVLRAGTVVPNFHASDTQFANVIASVRPRG